LYDYSEEEDSLSDIESTDEDSDGSEDSHQIINPDKQALQKLELDQAARTRPIKFMLQTFAYVTNANLPLQHG
jgi:hypothetical protein